MSAKVIVRIEENMTKKGNEVVLVCRIGRRANAVTVDKDVSHDRYTLVESVL